MVLVIVVVIYVLQSGIAGFHNLASLVKLTYALCSGGRKGRNMPRVWRRRGEQPGVFMKKLLAVKIQNMMQNMQNMINRRNLLHQNKSSNRRARILLSLHQE